MKNRLILLTLASCILMFASCSSHYEEQINEVNLKHNDLEPLTLSIYNKNADSDYKVTEEILTEYLKVTQKYKNVASILPLSSNNDTLVYFVKYHKGWEIIPADTRIGSVLATSDNSTGIAMETEFLKKHFKGVLDYVQSVKDSNEGSVARIWSYLQIKVLSKSDVNIQSTKSARGIVPGMWREIDEEPYYTQETNEIPHIIAAKWGQNSNWNKYMPLKTNNSNYPVGCGPVAVAQVIHHFRKSNSRDIKIPKNATLSPTPTIGNYPAFSGMSSNHWDSLSLTVSGNFINKEYTQIFLSYLGQQINAVLTQNGTGTDSPHLRTAFSLYKLSYNETGSYNYSTIFNNLYYGKPVIVSSDFNRVINGTENSNFEHYYIIDKYKECLFSMTTRYVWVPDYQPTDWELQTLPQWMFEDFWADGRDEMELLISRTEEVYFGMNWGYGDDTFDNLYLVRSYVSEHEDEPGIISSQETIYTPMWTVETKYIDEIGEINYLAKNISSVFYNIGETN